MKRRSQSITCKEAQTAQANAAANTGSAAAESAASVMMTVAPVIFLAAILAVWQGVSAAGWMPGYMLPSPAAVVRALAEDFPLLLEHSKTTLLEAFFGLASSIGICHGVFYGPVSVFTESGVSSANRQPDDSYGSHCAPVGAVAGVWHCAEGNAGDYHLLFSADDQSAYRIFQRRP